MQETTKLSWHVFGLLVMQKDKLTSEFFIIQYDITYLDGMWKPTKTETKQGVGAGQELWNYITRNELLDSGKHADVVEQQVTEMQSVHLKERHAVLHLPVGGAVSIVCWILSSLHFFQQLWIQKQEKTKKRTIPD